MSFSDLEYAGKRKPTRRNRFLAQLEAVTSWSALIASIEPFYPQGKGAGRPTIGLERMLRNPKLRALLEPLAQTLPARL